MARGSSAEQPSGTSPGRRPVDRAAGHEVHRGHAGPSPAWVRGGRRGRPPPQRVGVRIGSPSPGRRPSPGRPWRADGAVVVHHRPGAVAGQPGGSDLGRGDAAPASDLHRVDPDLLDRAHHALRPMRRTLRSAPVGAAAGAARPGRGGPGAGRPRGRSRRRAPPSTRASRGLVGVPARAAGTPPSQSTGPRWPRSELHRRQAATSFSSQEGPPLTRGTTCSVVGRHELSNVRPHQTQVAPSRASAARTRAARSGWAVTRPIVPAATRTCPSNDEPQASRSGGTWGSRPGGRYWVRTSDLFGVNEALSH